MFKKAFKTLKLHWPLALFLIAYLIVGITKYKDFGFTNEEVRFYKRGASYLNHLTGLKTDIENYEVFSKERIEATSHRELKESPVYSAKLVFLNLNKSLETFHLLNILMFLVVVLLSYVILYQKYRKSFLALIGPIFLLLHPRLLGHIPINPEDLGFVMVFFISLCAVYLLSKIKGKVLNTVFTRVLVLGILFGTAQTLNIYGYSLYIASIALFTHSILFRYKESSKKVKVEKIKGFLIEFSLILAFSHFTMFLLWPYIAANPFLNLADLFRSKFVESQIVAQEKFLGNFEIVSSLKYFATYFFFTSPVYQILLLIIGFSFFKKKRRDDLYFTTFIMLLVFAVFFSATNLNHSQGIREVLFLVPLISLFCSIIFIEIILEAKDSSLQNIFTLLVIVSMFTVTKDIISLHPFQYTYFNELIGGTSKAAKYFEIDYFDTSYKQAADIVIGDIQNNESTLFSCEQSALMKHYSSGAYTLTENKNDADYIVCQETVFDITTAFSVTRNGAVYNNISKINN